MQRDGIYKIKLVTLLRVTGMSFDLKYFEVCSFWIECYIKSNFKAHFSLIFNIHAVELNWTG
jgi:hypothetical protein